jgi:hypothetical protein
MPKKIGILRMQPSRRWAICHPGHGPVEITSGELFRIEVLHVRRMEYAHDGRGYYAVGGPELRSSMRAAIGSGKQPAMSTMQPEHLDLLRRLRAAFDEIYSQCQDYQGAWLTGVDRLRDLGRARSQATGRLFESRRAGTFLWVALLRSSRALRASS